MCGRFTLLSLGQFTDMFPWIRMPATTPAARYNVAPSQDLAVVANDGKNQIDFYRWGLVPFWAKDPSIGNRMINARAESLATKPAYRDAFRSRRCLIPADGFYEWKKNPAGGKTPMWIRMKSHAPFAFAGLWERWRNKDGDGGELRTCTIITGPPNDLVRPIHDRMPSILRAENYHQWLEPGERSADELVQLLAAYPASEMEASAVSRLVNSPSSDSPACIEAVESPPDIETNPPSLFG